MSGPTVSYQGKVYVLVDARSAPAQCLYLCSCLSCIQSSTVQLCDRSTKLGVGTARESRRHHTVLATSALVLAVEGTSFLHPARHVTDGVPAHREQKCDTVSSWCALPPGFTAVVE